MYLYQLCLYLAFFSVFLYVPVQRRKKYCVSISHFDLNLRTKVISIKYSICRAKCVLVSIFFAWLDKSMQSQSGRNSFNPNTLQTNRPNTNNRVKRIAKKRISSKKKTNQQKNNGFHDFKVLVCLPLLIFSCVQIHFECDFCQKFEYLCTLACSYLFSYSLSNEKYFRVQIFQHHSHFNSHIKRNIVH